MYWNDNKITFNANGGEININMRCIEINMFALVAIRTHGLTLTWDVLKWILESHVIGR